MIGAAGSFFLKATILFSKKIIQKLKMAQNNKGTRRDHKHRAIYLVISRKST